MLFTSYSFLFLFLPLVLLGHHLAPPRARNGILLLASYVFYAWWRVDFSALLLVSSVVDYACGRLIASTSDRRRRRRFLAISISANLSLLGYFKYANWGIENLNGVLAALGIGPVPWTDVLLPVGISFFTFQTMSYTIDVYRGRVAPSNSFLAFATYVAMFPQLVAGPIVRYRTVAAELSDRPRDPALFVRGALLFMIGFSKKVLVANNCGLTADAVFDPGPTGFIAAWVGLAAYTFQIYFDFSGYSDMAIGLGALFGFRYPKNFDAPYRAESITDFWRRWHITLTTWIRDYLYIPLGGNRGGTLRTYRNLALAMLLCGLWHGANWTFVIWGAFHGGLLVLERVRGRAPVYAGLPKPVRVGATMVLVMVGWLLFRSPDVDALVRYAAVLFNPLAIDVGALGFRLRLPETYLVLAVALAITYFTRTASEQTSSPSATIVAGHTALFLWALVELMSQQHNPFLYFQF